MINCDQVYDVNGKFEVKKNSQEPWTPVVIASFGSTRTLTFRLRDVYIGEPIPILMEDGDVFVLCPPDEYSSQYTFHKVKACKWTWGIKFGE